MSAIRVLRFLSRNRFKRTHTGAGTSWARRVQSGSLVMMLASVSETSSREKARVAVSISYSTHPNAHTSDRLSAGRPFACSGDTYAAVPRIMPTLVTREHHRKCATDLEIEHDFSSAGVHLSSDRNTAVICHSTIAPPLRLTTVPDIALAWSDATNTATLASSASVVKRLRCVMLSIRARYAARVMLAALANFSKFSRIVPVSGIAFGMRHTTRIPCGASSA